MIARNYFKFFGNDCCNAINIKKKYRTRDHTLLSLYLWLIVSICWKLSNNNSFIHLVSSVIFSLMVVEFTISFISISYLYNVNIWFVYQLKYIYRYDFSYPLNICITSIFVKQRSFSTLSTNFENRSRCISRLLERYISLSFVWIVGSEGYFWNFVDGDWGLGPSGRWRMGTRRFGNLE